MLEGIINAVWLRGAQVHNRKVTKVKKVENKIYKKKKTFLQNSKQMNDSEAWTCFCTNHVFLLKVCVLMFTYKYIVYYIILYYIKFLYSAFSPPTGRPKALQIITPRHWALIHRMLTGDHKALYNKYI